VQVAATTSRDEVPAAAANTVATAQQSTAAVPQSNEDGDIDDDFDFDVEDLNLDGLSSRCCAFSWSKWSANRNFVVEPVTLL